MRAVAALGVLLYAGIGIVCLTNGGTFLDYDFLFDRETEDAILRPARQPRRHQHWEAFQDYFIELGVLLTVAATMITIFYAPAALPMRRRRQSDPPPAAPQLCRRHHPDDVGLFVTFSSGTSSSE